MTPVTPSRFRHPIDDPDPVIARQYVAIFGRPIGSTPREQADMLGDALMRGDALADRWVAHSGALPESESARMFERAAKHGVASVRAAPEELQQLFHALESVPSWVDREQLDLGGRVFRRVGMFGMVVLSDFGLMGGYRSAAIAKTLMMTGRLRHGAAERLIHTGQFVIAATDPGQLQLGRAGYVAAAEVRVVHARVRRMLASLPSWRTEHWGVPINQADMLGTNLLFSIGYTEGCKQWGFGFTDDEVRAVLHLWRYVGYLLGVDDALIPTEVEPALRALYNVGVSQPGPDGDSRELARALYEVPLTFALSPLAQRLVRFEMGLRVSMSRRILGDEGVDQLGLPRSRMRLLAGPLVRAIRSVDAARRHVPFGEHAAYHLGDLFVKLGQRTIEARLHQAKELARAKGKPVVMRAPRSFEGARSA